MHGNNNASPSHANIGGHRDTCKSQELTSNTSNNKCNENIFSTYIYIFYNIFIILITFASLIKVVAFFGLRGERGEFLAPVQFFACLS
jgi:hypothetical protein